MADIIGRRMVFLVGCFLCSCFTLGCGLARTGTSLIVFRGFQGIAISLCLTTAVGIITNSFAPSTRRNIAFAATGAASPVGYTLGLVCGGVFVESIGWRWAYYMATIVNFALVVAAIWGLPRDEPATRVWTRMRTEIDWIGAAMATVAISLLSYVMAYVDSSRRSISRIQH
jgi:MFS family permease